MPSFWDLNEALKCIQEGESHINKLRKPEAVRALTAMAWFVRSIPGAPELLQEVRALAGRVTDGLDKPGTADYVDHPWRALMAQKGLTPYSYTTHLKQAGIPQAPPPLPGHAPAWSYVPDAGLVAGPGAGPGVIQAAAGTLGEQVGDDSIFSGLGTLTAIGGEGKGAGGEEEEDDVGGGDDDDDDSEGKVTTPLLNDDHERVGVVDDSARTGNVRPPAETDPLVADGSTVGRKDAGQSQVQAGAQVQDPAGSIKRKLCKSVWRDDVCRDRDCSRAHPPRCGDPRCFPIRRTGCQHWHRIGGDQRQQRQRQQQQQQQHHRPQQQRQLPQKPQGNGSSAGPGRAGRRQGQGGQPAVQHQRGPRPHQGRQQQQQHPRQVQQGGQRQGQLQQRQGQRQQRQHQSQSGQHQHQHQPSYRDVAASGTSLSLSPINGSFGNANVGFAPVQHDQAMLNTVVATVMAVLAGRNHHF